MRSLVPGLALASAALFCAACGGSIRTATTTVATQPARTARASVAAPAPKPKPKPEPNPGSLPQTDQLPSGDSAQFHAEMASLWSGVTHDSLQAALPAFFPERAYTRVKAIADPRADYTGRLVAEYQLDLGAAHALLGSQAKNAQLVAVEVPTSYAHWVDPGACYNRVGYYEVPNARVVYRVRAAVSSFGIASLISWRGVWYVVHLGAVLRPGAGGVVDDPSNGPGQAAPSSTC